MIPHCSILGLGRCIRAIVEGIVGHVLVGVWEVLQQAVAVAMAEAVRFVIGTVGTIWIQVPTVPVSDDRFVPTDVVMLVQGRVSWLAAALATVSVIVAGAKMAFTQRGEALREGAGSLLTLVVASVFGIAVCTVLIRVADAVAEVFIEDVTRTKLFGDRIDDMVNGPFRSLTLPLALLLGLAMIVSGLLQVGLMLVRNGVLVLLVGVLPLAAAATNTEMGKAWFRRLTGWLVAFIAYKPVAALVYAAAFRMFGDDIGGAAGLVRVTTGVTLMVMAIVALPALIRFVSPTVG